MRELSIYVTNAVNIFANIAKALTKCKVFYLFHAKVGIFFVPLSENVIKTWKLDFKQC